ncbi:unnamed protein product [Fraxinus pennsylvanica]|uniref:Uncharacterized protein n=1 Tax=Fraxinus pennsylvanica TaxID=56036 RepID=A0AAD2A8W2_9LAMI|nr:unnamed protein product [Fraxinus pennsylvanica]
MKVPLLLDLQVCTRFLLRFCSHFHPCHTTWFIALGVALTGMTKGNIRLAVRKANKEKENEGSTQAKEASKCFSVFMYVGGAEDESDESKFEVNGDEDDESFGDEEDNKQALSQKTRLKLGQKEERGNVSLFSFLVYRLILREGMEGEEVERLQTHEQKMADYNKNLIFIRSSILNTSQGFRVRLETHSSIIYQVEKAVN